MRLPHVDLNMNDFKDKEVLFLGAHPDDIEIGCFGVISLLSILGCNITFCICTSEGIRKDEIWVFWCYVTLINIGMQYNILYLYF